MRDSSSVNAAFHEAWKNTASPNSASASRDRFATVQYHHATPVRPVQKTCSDVLPPRSSMICHQSPRLFWMPLRP